MKLLTLRSILAATDLEPTSLAALRAAARLADLAEAELHLLHVTESQQPHSLDRLTEHFRQSIDSGPADPTTVSTVVGAAAATIVERARSLNADVVVFGRHRGGLAHRPLGSTAATVVRAAHCPCLAVSTDLRLPLERVLVATDLSDAAESALAVALSWASALRPPRGTAQLTALHVADDGAHANAAAVLREQVERTRAATAGIARVELDYEVEGGGAAAQHILQKAAASRADLLVMGTRGPAGSRSKLGSVSEAVTRAAPCPLLLVPPAELAADRGA
jgi:nucleotide-binding universal stress UspA family protein